MVRLEIENVRERERERARRGGRDGRDENQKLKMRLTLLHFPLEQDVCSDDARISSDTTTITIDQKIDSSSPNSVISLEVKYVGKSFAISIPIESTILSLKEKIQEFTNVLPKRQKLIGLVKGKAPDDSVSRHSIEISLPSPEKKFQSTKKKKKKKLQIVKNHYRRRS